MTNSNNSGDKRSDSGGGRGNNRRRYFRRRKPSAKGQEPAKAASSQPESSKPEPRRTQEAPPRGRTRNNAKAEFSGKGDRDQDRNRDRNQDRDRDRNRDRRGRRRRRRSQSDRDGAPVAQQSIMAAIDHDYKPPKSVFVYTYVLRPGAPSLHEFRPEHFSRVGRRLEDFEIDLSPVFPVEGAPKKEARPVLAMDSDEDINSTNYNYDDGDDEFPDESTDH